MPLSDLRVGFLVSALHAFWFKVVGLEEGTLACFSLGRGGGGGGGCGNGGGDGGGGGAGGVGCGSEGRTGGGAGVVMICFRPSTRL